MGSEVIDGGPQAGAVDPTPISGQPVAHMPGLSPPTAESITRESVGHFVRLERLTATDIKLVQRLAALARTNPNVLMSCMEGAALPDSNTADIQARLETSLITANGQATAAQFLLDCLRTAQEVKTVRLEARFDAKAPARQQLVSTDRYHELLRANHIANHGPYDAAPSFRAIQYFTISAVANMIAAHRPDAQG